MIYPLARICAILLCLALFPGCALLAQRSEKKRRVAAEKAMAEARRHPLHVGQIALVNVEDRFVLIDAVTPQNPRVGSIWRTYRAGALSGELRATGVRRRPWVIADIAHGEPQTGDTVLQPAEAEPSAAPRAEAVRSEPVAPPPPKPVPFWKRWFGKGRG